MYNNYQLLILLTQVAYTSCLKPIDKESYLDENAVLQDVPIIFKVTSKGLMVHS